MGARHPKHTTTLIKSKGGAPKTPNYLSISPYYSRFQSSSFFYNISIVYGITDIVRYNRCSRAAATTAAAKVHQFFIILHRCNFNNNISRPSRYRQYSTIYPSSTALLISFRRRLRSVAAAAAVYHRLLLLH